MTTTTSTTLTGPAGTPRRSALRASARRTWGLTRANAVLMARNRLTLAYGLLLPLLPLVNVVTVPRDDQSAAAPLVASVLLLAYLFPVYYNVLSQVVSRRDELVLKRLRTGEVRDRELLVSIALPGVTVALGVAALTVAIGAVRGWSLPVNPVLCLVSVLGGCALFAALATWTAAWTRNAEAAQLTSMPILTVALLGSLRSVLPQPVLAVVDRTPGAALDTLVRLTWFGQGADAEVSLAQTWGAALEPLAVVAAWTALAIWLARRCMRWEPRT